MHLILIENSIKYLINMVFQEFKNYKIGYQDTKTEIYFFINDL